MIDLFAALFPHSSTTDGVTVRVAVSYLAEQSSPEAGRWFWSYHVRIENHRKDTVQLLSRYWQIIDGRGMIQEVRGQGVVGEMPVIEPGDSYDYVSGCPLGTSNGQMRGHYRLVATEEQALKVEIPGFPLLAPVINR